MKFLLLIIGLFSCIAGIFLKQDAIRKKEGKFWIVSGCLLILVNFIFLLLKIRSSVVFAVSILAIVVISGTIKFKDYRPKFLMLTDRQNNILKWSCFFSIMFLFGWFMINAAIVPKITLENGIIHMGGIFGGDFKFSNIQSVDTVCVYPRVGFRHSGSGFPGISVGNYDLANENMPAKLCIYRNNPPYIKIRMNDNRLLLFNFNKPERTLEFYSQLQNTLKNN